MCTCRSPLHHPCAGRSASRSTTMRRVTVRAAPTVRSACATRYSGPCPTSICRVPPLVRDVGDMTAVARPARRRGVELAVGEGKHVPPVGGHEPQLIPLAAEVGAVHDAGAVGGPVRTRLPRSLLVPDLAQRRAGSGVHAPESTRPVDMPAVRYDQQLAPVRGPRGRDTVVPPGVVVARQPGVVVFREPGDLAAGGS